MSSSKDFGVNLLINRKQNYFGLVIVLLLVLVFSLDYFSFKEDKITVIKMFNYTNLSENIIVTNKGDFVLSSKQLSDSYTFNKVLYFRLREGSTYKIQYIGRDYIIIKPIVVDVLGIYLGTDYEEFVSSQYIDEYCKNLTILFNMTCKERGL